MILLFHKASGRVSVAMSSPSSEISEVRCTNFALMTSPGSESLESVGLKVL